jgi:hypothetical protein
MYAMPRGVVGSLGPLAAWLRARWQRGAAAEQISSKNASVKP